MKHPVYNTNDSITCKKEQLHIMIKFEQHVKVKKNVFFISSVCLHFAYI